MLPRSHMIILFTAALFRCSVATASWPPDGLLVSDTASHFNNHIPTVADDRFGGVYVAWQWSGSPVGLSIQDPRLQRLRPSGEVAPGWPPHGVQLTAAARNQAPRFICPDGVGGVYVVWADIRGLSTGNSIDVYAQRVLENGTVDPAWPADGLPIAAKPQEQDLLSAVSDGTGGLFISWSDRSPADGGDVMGIRIQPNGTAAPGWPVGGKPIAPVSPFAQAGGQIVADGIGGIYTVYGMFEPDINIYARHINAQGDVAYGWPSSDVPLTRAPNTQGGRVISDGAGGLYTAWHDDRSRGSAAFSEQYFDIYAQHMLADGTIAPGWPADGLPVCLRAGIQQVPDLVSDGAGGVFVVWEEGRSGTPWDLYGVRLYADGTLAPGWAANGTPVMAGFESHQMFRLAQDGMGGFYAAAEGSPSGQIWVQHMMANGQPETGWALQGTRVTPNYSGQEWPAVAWDGYGGAYVAWDDARYGETSVFVKHYGNDLTAVAVSLVSAEAEPGLARIAWQVNDGTGGRFTLERRTDLEVWKSLATIAPTSSGRITYDDRVPKHGRYFYRLAYMDDGIRRETPEVQLDVPSAHVLSLAGFTPNPISSANLSIAFTLPKQASGSVVLFDITGREIAREDLTGLGPGRHALRLGAQSQVPAGVYWMRLTHGDRALTSRGVVIR